MEHCASQPAELVALDVEDVEEGELGFRVAIRRSKTDQEGAGQTIAIIHHRSERLARGGRHNVRADLWLRQERGRGGGRCLPSRSQTS